MSNSSRMACSLAPAYFHHCRSSASMRWSRSLSGLASSTSASSENALASAEPATTHLLFLVLADGNQSLLHDKAESQPCHSLPSGRADCGPEGNIRKDRTVSYDDGAL